MAERPTDASDLRRLEVDIPMRDGVELRADVYLGRGEDPRPVLLVRTPYGRRAQIAEVYAHPSWYVDRGFVVVCEDTRGRGDSPGEFAPFEHETLDGCDTVEWIASQPWCSGAVGSYGFSYSGAVQLSAAVGRPRGLRAMAPAMTASNIGTGWVYRNGALQLAWILTWTAELGLEAAARAGDEAAVRGFSELLAQAPAWLARLPVASAFPDVLRPYVPYFSDWLSHSPEDTYWTERSPAEGLGRVAVPGLWIAGWYDVFLEGTLDAYERVVGGEGGEPQLLVVGPWWHTPWGQVVGEVDFGPTACNTVDELQARFFARFLLGEDNGIDKEASVHLFVMGENRWRSFESWPPPAPRTVTYHLRSDGRANSLNGTGRLEPAPASGGELADRLASSPGFPIASLGGRSCCYPEISPMGPADQRGQERRNDVLVYDSEPLGTDLVIVGRPAVVLSLAADQPSADVILRLVDVDPEGRAINVADANARLDFGPETVHELRLLMSATAVMIRSGHRIRLDVMETNFPMFDRNPHGVHALSATLLDLAPVTLSVLHDHARPSRLELPVL